MGYVNVFLSKPCRLSVKNRQFVVLGEEEHTFPLEDLNAVLIETGECTVTAVALRALADAGAAVFVCDEKHLPNGVLLPYKGYYRPLQTLRMQLDVSRPLQKRLWQCIVKRKIENQARCLAIYAKGTEPYLFDLVKTVGSDDARNVEATAANYYFRNLFGKAFSREAENGTNAALNYGYALVRGILARTLSLYGFESSFGLHHANQLNNFNLADDLMEPYRAIVDQTVCEMSLEEGLTTQAKRDLFSLFSRDVEMDGQVYALSYAIERTVQSLKSSLENGEVRLLLPKLLPKKTHRYE